MSEAAATEGAAAVAEAPDAGTKESVTLTSGEVREFPSGENFMERLIGNITEESAPAEPAAPEPATPEPTKAAEPATPAEPEPEPTPAPEPKAEAPEPTMELSVDNIPGPEAPKEEKPEKTGDGVDFAKEDELPGDWKPEAKLKWGELRGELVEERTKAAELQKRVTELESGNAATELERQVAEQKELLATYEKELSVSRVESTEDYKRAVTQPLEAIAQAAAAVAERHSVDGERLLDAFADPNPTTQAATLQELVKEMNERDRMSVYRMADDTAVIFNKDQEIKSNAASALAEVEAQQAKVAEETSQKDALAMRQGVNRVFDLFAEKAVPVEESVLAKAKEVALKEDLSTASAESKAFGVSAGLLMPHLIRAIQARDKEIAGLKTQAEGFHAASPAVGSGVGVSEESAESAAGSFLSRMGVRDYNLD